ncbi:transcriptional regulator TetR family [Coprobacillus sp. CAG:826]|nr:transcriptional regulator TetR family [Coprobacillus sp. CAG:826]
MARKPKFDGGTRNRMLEVATKMFFEKSYEGTSVRDIVKEVGCEVGLFYYYYKTKDDLFTDVMEHFFEPYKKDFEILVEDAKINQNRALLRFFEYMKKKVIEFREKYSANMHRTIRWAIREQALTVIEPYIEQIIQILVEHGAQLKMDVHLTAIFLAHGIGSVILHEDADYVKETTNQLRKVVNLIMGLSEEQAKYMFGN